MRKVDKPLILYGKGKLGKLAAEIFDKLDIKHTMMDKYDRYPQVGHGGALVAVCVATESYNSLVYHLHKRGWEDVVPVWDIVQAYPEVGIHLGWRGEATDNKHFTNIAMNFKDNKSLFDLIAFWEWRMSRREQKDFVPIPAPHILKSDLHSIYARKKVRLTKRGNTVYVHNEGHELETLWYHMKHIQDTRPKLIVSCYHSRDGLWRIPRLLIDNLKDYNIQFRLHAYMGLGATMYCTPKEIT